MINRIEKTIFQSVSIDYLKKHFFFVQAEKVTSSKFKVPAPAIFERDDSEVPEPDRNGVKLAKVKTVLMGGEEV